MQLFDKGGLQRGNAINKLFHYYSLGSLSKCLCASRNLQNYLYVCIVYTIVIYAKYIIAKRHSTAVQIFCILFADILFNCILPPIDFNTLKLFHMSAISRYGYYRSD